jgi:hypothetical protein
LDWGRGVDERLIGLRKDQGADKGGPLIMSRQKERPRTRDREKCYWTHTVDSDERDLSIEKWTEEKWTVFDYDHRSIRGIRYYLVQIMYIPICFSHNLFCKPRRLPTRARSCFLVQYTDVFLPVSTNIG